MHFPIVHGTSNTLALLRINIPPCLIIAIVCISFIMSNAHSLVINILHLLLFCMNLVRTNVIVNVSYTSSYALLGRYGVEIAFLQHCPTSRGLHVHLPTGVRFRATVPVAFPPCRRGSLAHIKCWRHCMCSTRADGTVDAHRPSAP